MAVLLATQYIPLAFHDSLSLTIRQVFPDSQIALKYDSTSTKVTCMFKQSSCRFSLERLNINNEALAILNFYRHSRHLLAQSQ